MNDIKASPDISKIGMWLISQLSKGNPPPKYENVMIIVYFSCR